MTGQELIDWIKEHHAEEMKVVVQYRDSGGIYQGVDGDVEPEKVLFLGEYVVVL